MDIKRLNVAVPRYTSYPPVPYWDGEHFRLEGYTKTLSNAYWESCKEVSIYIHLPFCENLCTYCACNTRITKNHDVEAPYMQYLIKEWKMYLDLLPGKPKVKEIHLGGGTPTFFAPKNLKALLEGIMDGLPVAEDPQFAFEGHPGNTTTSHLQVLHELGFKRVSFGIQDFDLDVQKLINRMQSFDQVKAVTEAARQIGYDSVNYDMVYGLPGQTEESVATTLEKIIKLRPERIAYYSYAHVPKMKPAQKSFEDYLPSAELKFKFSQMGKRAFLDAGYEEIGMDHYVLPSDELVKAQQTGDLHRNFMGYTTFTSKLLIGLGVSAISDTWSGFAQNEKTIPNYYKRLDANELPIVRGHLHTSEDLFIRKHILNLMCQFETSWLPQEFLQFGIGFDHERLQELETLGYIFYNERNLIVHPKGKEIIRIICAALDRNYERRRSSSTTFSKAV